MKFIVVDVADNTKKSNLITYQIINTDTKLDGLFVKSYAPKSVQLVCGLEQDIPFFVAKGIFGFNRPNNVKSLEKQLQAKAPKGEKRLWRSEAGQLFDQIAKLNVEQPVPVQGQFVGNVGDLITFVVDQCVCVHSNHYVSHIGWRHNGHGWERPTSTKCLWKITDVDNNVYMFSTGGKVTNDFLSNISSGDVLTTTVDSHDVFNNMRQTWITRPKKAGGLFEIFK